MKTTKTSKKAVSQSIGAGALADVLAGANPVTATKIKAKRLQNASKIDAWAGSTKVELDENRIMTIIGVSCIVKSKSARTTEATVTVTELANWDLVSQNKPAVFAGATPILANILVVNANILWSRATTGTTGASFNTTEQADYTQITTPAQTSYDYLVYLKGTNTQAFDVANNLVLSTNADAGVVLNAVLTLGGNVFVKAGTYIFNTNVNFHNKSSYIKGVKGKTIFKAGTVSGGLFYDYVGSNTVATGNREDITFDGVTFDQNSVATLSGLSMGSTNNLTIKDCKFKNTNGIWACRVGGIGGTLGAETDGDILASASNKIRIYDTDFSDNSCGTFEPFLIENGLDVVFYNNTGTNNTTTSSVASFWLYCRRVIIQGNSFSGNKARIFDVTCSADTVMLDNILDYTAGDLFDAIRLINVSNVQVADNKNISGFGGGFGGVFVRHTDFSTTIDGHINKYPNSTNVHVYDNNVKNAYYTYVYPGFTTAGYSVGASDISVCNNQSYNGFAEQISIGSTALTTNMSRVRVSGNYVAPATLFGGNGGITIIGNGTMDDVYVSDNFVKPSSVGGNSAGIYAVNCTNLLLEDNNVRGTGKGTYNDIQTNPVGGGADTNNYVVKDSSSYDYIIRKNGTDTECYDTAKKIVIRRSADASIPIQFAVDLMDSTGVGIQGVGGGIHILPGDYPLNTEIQIRAVSQYSGSAVSRMIRFHGSGIDTTRLNPVAGVNGINFIGSFGMWDLGFLTVTVQTTSNGITSDVLAGGGTAGQRGMWLSEIHDIMVRGSGAHTGYAYRFQNPFRSVFRNLEAIEVGNGVWIENLTTVGNGKFGDSTWDRSFMHLRSAMVNGIAYKISSASASEAMNQFTFNMIEGIGDPDGTNGGVGSKFLEITGGLNWCQFRGMNAEQFQTLIDASSGSITHNTFQLNYVSNRNAFGTVTTNGGTGFAFGASSLANTVSCGFYDISSSTVPVDVINDSCVDTSRPNTFNDVFIRADTNSQARVNNTTPTATTVFKNVKNTNQNALSRINTGTGCIFAQTASVTVANTVAETTLVGTGVGKLILPPHTLTVGKTFKVTAMGTFARASGNQTLRLKLGATNIFATTTGNPGAGSATAPFIFTGMFTVRSQGAAGTVFTQMETRHQTGIAMSFALNVGSNAAVTVDTTVSQTINVTAQHSIAAAGNSATLTNLIVEALN